MIDTGKDAIDVVATVTAKVGETMVEEGTHESLLSKKGRYHDLFETQAKYYCDHPVTREVNYG